MKQKMKNGKKAVVLVGHGASAKDCPREMVMRLKGLEGKRLASGGDYTQEEIELEQRIRKWPRTPQTDPYKAGLESLAAHLKSLLGEMLVTTAYNEFCAPTIEEAVEDLIAKGATHIRVIPSMLTPGGVHSEVEIPAILQKLRLKYPKLGIRYIWPFNLKLIADTFAAHLEKS